MNSGSKRRRWIVLASAGTLVAFGLFVLLAEREKLNAGFVCRKCALYKHMNHFRFGGIPIRDDDKYERTSIHKWLTRHRGHCKQHAWACTGGHSRVTRFSFGDFEYHPELGLMGGMRGDWRSGGIYDLAFQSLQPHLDDERLGEFADFLLMDHEALTRFRAAKDEYGPLQSVVAMQAFNAGWEVEKGGYEGVRAWWDAKIRPRITLPPRMTPSSTPAGAWRGP